MPIKLFLRHFRRLVKFGISGSSGAVIDFSGLFVLLHAGVDRRFAVVLSSIPAVIIVFLLNKYFTFGVGKGNTRVQAAKFVMVYTAAFLWNAGLSLVFLGLSFSPFWAKFLAIGCVALWNYCLLNCYVFRKHGGT